MRHFFSCSAWIASYQSVIWWHNTKFASNLKNRCSEFLTWSCWLSSKASTAYHLCYRLSLHDGQIIGKPWAKLLSQISATGPAPRLIWLYISSSLFLACLD
jgi:hypothetical protein